MGIANKSFVLILVTLFLISLIIFQPANAKSNILENNSLYAIPDENATIILLKGASYGDTTNYYPAHNTSNGYVPSSWLFALFSTGNGTTGITISAHDCNVTITSYNYYLKDMGDYFFRADSWLNYTVTGAGIQRLDYSELINLNNSNPTVYIDGITREQGEGWNKANFGITVNGALSTVSIHQESMEYLPPRNPPRLEPIDYLLPAGIIVAIVVLSTIFLLLLFRRH